jgi:hypothetical protein
LTLDLGRDIAFGVRERCSWVVVRLESAMPDLRHTFICAALLVIWVAWCLFAIDWRKLWPRLAEGGWAPLVLLTLMIAGVWSWMAPGTCNCLGIPVPTFWWHVLATALIVGLGLFCGWLQMLMHWHPTEVELHPAPAHGHDHGHGHEHHEHGHDEPSPAEQGH